MKLSDLPPGVSIFDEHINPSDDRVTVLTLLSEEQVTQLKAAGKIWVGQCHAAEIEEGRVLEVCSSNRRAYKRTCEKHKLVRGRDLLAAHVAAKKGHRS